MTDLNAIEVENLTKRFGNFTAVDHIDFKVKAGELFGFLGPNGAGKTTTVRTITGVIKPDGGRARIMGYDVEREIIKAKQVVGVLPETSNAYIDLSAWQKFNAHGQALRAGKEGKVILLDFAAIVLFTVLFMALAMVIHARNMPKRL